MTVSHLIVFFTKAINSSVSTSCYVHLVTAGCSDSPLCLLRCKQYTESVTKPLCSCTMNSWTFLFQFPISKRFGKGQALPKNTWHNWMNHMSITVNHGIASTNQINKRRGLPPTEPVGKLNLYPSWKKKTVSIQNIRSHHLTNSAALQRHISAAPHFCHTFYLSQKSAALAIWTWPLWNFDNISIIKRSQASQPFSYNREFKKTRSLHCTQHPLANRADQFKVQHIINS